MARVKFNKALGIASISGRIGNLIFYNRKGRTYVRSARRHDDERADLEALSSHSRGIIESDDAFKSSDHD